MAEQSRKSVYLDSTVPSYYHDQRRQLQAFIDVTRAWWDEQRANFDLYVSEATLVELHEGDYPRKAEVTSLVHGVDVLAVTNDVEAIAEVYVEQFVMPKGALGDAFHLAVASYYKCDYLLTWNCNHLANANKRQHIQIVNTRLGLFVPQIVTPLELFPEQQENNDVSPGQ